MFFNEWNILVVDDEPDVLSVTRLALRDVTIYGLPVKIHTAASKAEAIELLKGPLAMKGSSEPILPVAIVDVVMETDYAGLELCEYIRNKTGGQSVQLFIRTGQPGVAPERKVIDEYDISGYFTKLELSEQKLYTLVKSGVRQWLTIWYALTIEAGNTNLITHSGSRKDFLEAIGWFGEPGPQESEGVTGFQFGRDLIVSDYPEYIKPLHDRLDVLKPVIRTVEGHKLAMDELGTILVKTVKTKTTADYYYVAESAMIMPRLLLDLTFRSGLVYSSLWKKITDAEKAAGSKNQPKKSKSTRNRVNPSLRKPVKKVAIKQARRRK